MATTNQYHRSLNFVEVIECNCKTEAMLSRRWPARQSASLCKPKWTAFFSTTRPASLSTEMEDDIEYLKFREHLYFSEKRLKYEAMIRWLDENVPPSPDLQAILRNSGKGDYICSQKLENMTRLAHRSREIKAQLRSLRDHDKDLENEPYPAWEPDNLGRKQREERDREDSLETYAISLSTDVKSRENDIKKDLERFKAATDAVRMRHGESSGMESLSEDSTDPSFDDIGSREELERRSQEDEGSDEYDLESDPYWSRVDDAIERDSAGI